MGNNTWWSLVKEKQGISRQNSIPPLTKKDGTVVTSSKKKTQLLVNLCAEKMKVEDPSSPRLVWSNSARRLTKVEVTQTQLNSCCKDWTPRKPLALMMSACTC